MRYGGGFPQNLRLETCLVVGVLLASFDAREEPVSKPKGIALTICHFHSVRSKCLKNGPQTTPNSPIHDPYLPEF